ncbi:MAG: transposase domain-containing protein [Gammaproteobacteria bacterium]|nr:transposase domain-containing protein [Gammaproteobacteria bacterium]
MYSLIVTTRAIGLEPYGYLRRVFTQLPRATTVDEIESLLAYRIVQEHTDLQ